MILRPSTTSVPLSPVQTPYSSRFTAASAVARVRANPIYGWPLWVEFRTVWCIFPNGTHLVLGFLDYGSVIRYIKAGGDLHGPGKTPGGLGPVAPPWSQFDFVMGEYKNNGSHYVNIWASLYPAPFAKSFVNNLNLWMPSGAEPGPAMPLDWAKSFSAAGPQGYRNFTAQYVSIVPCPNKIGPDYDSKDFGFPDLSP